MEINRTLTATVYVVKDSKVLLHMHKKYNTLFPLGGHMEPDELPHETAKREAYEEAGLSIKFYCDEEQLELGRVRQLHRPVHVLLENIGQSTENIDFIYFATTDEDKIQPQEGESTQLFWLSKDEIIANESIKPHIRSMAIRALEVVN